MVKHLCPSLPVTIHQPQNILCLNQILQHLNWGNHLISSETSPLPDGLDASIKDLINGVWYKAPGEAKTITYYQCLYNGNYSAAVTTLQVDVSLASMIENFASLSGTLYTSFENDTNPIRFTGNSPEFTPFHPDKTDGGQISVCETAIAELHLTMLQELDLEASLNYNGSTLLILLLLLFLVLSAGYYGITTSITRRISRLQKHISQSQADNLVPLKAPGYRDIIGRSRPHTIIW